MQPIIFVLASSKVEMDATIPHIQDMLGMQNPKRAFKLITHVDDFRGWNNIVVIELEGWGNWNGLPSFRMEERYLINNQLRAMAGLRRVQLWIKECDCRRPV